MQRKFQILTNVILINICQWVYRQVMYTYGNLHKSPRNQLRLQNCFLFYRRRFLKKTTPANHCSIFNEIHQLVPHGIHAMFILVLLLFNRRTKTIVQKIIQSFHDDKIFSIENNNIFCCYFSSWYKEHSHCFYIPKNKQKILQSFLSILPILICLHERNDGCGM